MIASVVRRKRRSLILKPAGPNKYQNKKKYQNKDDKFLTGTNSLYIDLLDSLGELRLREGARKLTKVYKLGVLCGLVDLSSFYDFKQLMDYLAKFKDHREGWVVVYVDEQNDVMLLGDGLWEDFLGCVQCIKLVLLERRCLIDANSS